MNTQETRKTEKKSVLNTILNVVGVALCVVLLPVLLINITLIIRSYTNPDEVPSFASYLPLIVLTDSMYPEIQGGDLIICHTAEAEDIAVGDVIAFFDPSGNGTAIVTHRVVEVTQQDGAVAWRTRGDANNADDSALVPGEKLVGIYRSRIPGVGNVAMFMKSTEGLIICVVLPIILLVGYDLIRRKLYDRAHKKDTEALLRELEELRAAQNSQTTQNK